MSQIERLEDEHYYETTDIAFLAVFMNRWGKYRRADERTAASDHLKPCHVAILLAGRARWASRHGVDLHQAAAQSHEAVMRLILAARAINLRFLTLRETDDLGRRADCGFSPEASGRYADDFHQLGISVVGLSDDGMPAPGTARHEELFSLTSPRLTVIIPKELGAREELVSVARTLASEVQIGTLALSEITPASIAGRLQTSSLPEPDLIIHTGGQVSIANFYLWESAYAEFVFSPRLWPEFTPDDLRASISDYSSRQRRFGGRPTG